MYGKQIYFKLYTSAEVTAVSEETFKTLPEVILRKPSKNLFGPSHQALEVVGEFTGKISAGGTTHECDIYVIKCLQDNLLGLTTNTGLQLVQRLCSTSKEEDVKHQFPIVFNGFGTFGEEYEIKLQDDATPHTLYTPRNVPIPKRKKVKEELDRIESIRVITTVSEPTPWCAGMVVVPKKSEKVRICVDLKPLNKVVIRETHPIPKVDDTLAQLTGATGFSKLDANSGFW